MSADGAPETRKNSRKRSNIAILFALCGTLFSVLIFIFMLKQEREASIQQFKVEVTQGVASFQQRLERELYRLDSLQLGMELNQTLPADAIDGFLSHLRSQESAISGLIYQTSEGEVQRYSATAEDTLTEAEFISAYLSRKTETGGLDLSGQRDADRGWILASRSLSQKDRATLLIDLQQLLEQSKLNAMLSGVSLQLVEGDTLLLDIPVAEVAPDAQYTLPLNLAGDRWQITLGATEERLNTHMSYTPALFLLTGLLLSIMLASYLKRVGALVAAQRDQAEEETAEEQQQVSWHDPMTGLANRIRFDEALDVECRRAVREFSPMSLMLLRIDHFNHYGDRYGVEEAQTLLRRVSELFQSRASRPGDIIARLDDHLFAFILPSTNEQVVMLAQRCCDMVREQAVPHEDKPKGELVTLSVGVVTLQPSRELTPERLFSIAEEQMKEAIDAGGDQFKAFAEGGFEPSATYTC